MDPSQLGNDLTPVLALAVLVSLVKPFLEQRVAPTNRLHDPAIRLLAVALGILGLLADYLLNAHGITGAGIEHAIGGGAGAGIGAILTYHLVSGDVFSNAAPLPPRTLSSPQAGG